MIYAKHLEDGSMAVGLFNRGWQTVKMNFTLRMLGLRGRQTVRDLWRQKDLTECTDKFETAVAPHGVVLVRVYPGQQPRTGDRQIARPCFIINKRRIPAYPSFS